MTLSTFGYLLLILLIGTLRFQIALYVVPFFGPGVLQGIPRRLVTVASVVIVWPILLPAAMETRPDFFHLVALAGKEVILGSLIGLFCGVIFWAVESAGEYIDLQRGSTAAGVFNPMFGATNSPLGNLIVRLYGVIFWASGGFIVFLTIILTSFELYPPYELLPAFGHHTVNLVTSLVGSIFLLSILFAAPILIIFLLTDLSLGLMNRFVPQLNVFFLSMSIKSALGLFFLTFYLAIMLAVFNEKIFHVDEVLAFLKAVFP